MPLTNIAKKLVTVVFDVLPDDENSILYVPVDAHVMVKGVDREAYDVLNIVATSVVAIALTYVIIAVEPPESP